jgi:hypothetical protein
MVIVGGHLRVPPLLADRHIGLPLLIMCFLLTAPIHAQPTECDPAAPLSNGAPSTSPDGRYTLTIACYDPDATAYPVYVTDNRTGNTSELGTVTDTRRGVTGDGINYVFVSQWLDDTRALLRAETGGGTYNWRYAFLADVDAETVTLLAADYVASPRYFDDPDRIEWGDEDGVNAKFTVYAHTFEDDTTATLYTGDCLLRDELENALSCHMVTPSSNASFTEDGVPTRLILNVGDSAREVKTIEVRDLTDEDGALLYTADTLGMGYAEWLSEDTAAVFNLAFDFDTGGFAGLFVRFDDDGDVTDTAPFSLPHGDPLTERPPWLPTEVGFVGGHLRVPPS